MDKNKNEVEIKENAIKLDLGLNSDEYGHLIDAFSLVRCEGGSEGAMG